MATYDQQFPYGFEEYPQNLEFQNFESSPNNYQYNSSNLYPSSPFADAYASPNPSQIQPNIFTPTFETKNNELKDHLGYDEDEPPLLEELEINPTRIVEKSLAVLNPFHSKGLADDPEFFFKETDLAGPIGFYLALAFCLFLSDSGKDMFGYVYGLSLLSVMFMYVLMKLMSTTLNDVRNYISITSVASILGYSILPIVWLSVPGIFFSLNNKIGILLAGAAVLLSTTASSRIFCLMTGDQNQRFLIAYPCAVVYVIFTLLVLF
ncbi:CLUMA_CG010057, isoform A [Clunio marinus]|uniref:CLUMA_CG010057, isoform A n=1 Tax=Clunio marinus TaxID=568069 RepID=A0A1J1I9C1_9DIPT|nr:CLUMA_CG010057, isoform A [Clunio marinus]